MTLLVNDWMESLASEKTAPAMGYRGVATAKPEKIVDLSSKIKKMDKIIYHMEILHLTHPENLDVKIRGIWVKIPWEELINAIEDGLNWDGFLRKAGHLIKENLDQNELYVLISWLDKGDLSNEQKLLNIITRASILN
jgi:hypothetical protein